MLKENLMPTRTIFGEDAWKSKIFLCKDVRKSFIDPKNRTRSCWSLLKIILNAKKIPCIPPIFHNRKYIIHFIE